MNIPERIRIGYKEYRIEAQGRQDTDNDSHLGFVSHDHNLIRSQAHGEKSECANTLLHEILHCCCHVGEMGLDYDNEERAVSILANHLIAAMQDNPEVFRWIISNAKK